jgi:hypothetical protein
MRISRFRLIDRKDKKPNAKQTATKKTDGKQEEKKPEPKK